MGRRSPRSAKRPPQRSLAGVVHSDRTDDPAVIEALGRAPLAQEEAGVVAQLFERLVEVAADKGEA